MIVRKLKEYPLLPIAPDTELEDYSGDGDTVLLIRFLGPDRFCAGSGTYDFAGCSVFSGLIIKNIYSTTQWGITDQPKYRTYSFSPRKLTRL
jgi:hypothetical protein